MKRSKYFEQIYLKSVTDLPKDFGVYYCEAQFDEGDFGFCNSTRRGFYSYSESSREDWIKWVIWYTVPMIERNENMIGYVGECTSSKRKNGKHSFQSHSDKENYCNYCGVKLPTLASVLKIDKKILVKVPRSSGCDGCYISRGGTVGCNWCEEDNDFGIFLEKPTLDIFRIGTLPPLEGLKL